MTHVTIKDLSINNQELIQELSKYDNITLLEIINCPNITKLPELPKSLEWLDCSYCTGLIKLPQHSSIKLII